MLNDSIFWVDVDKIKPNPYQPRKEFDEAKLRELADSIRQYGILQPLVVTRREIEREDGGLFTEYELIAGERRLRASKFAGIMQVPVIIREGTEEENARMKLELALIENIQREDLNPVDRACAFKQLADEFNFKHHQIAERVGKSREYVSNSIRLLMLPEEMVLAVSEGKMSEGHTRPLLMLIGRPEEQRTLFKDILIKKLNVRDAERIARETAVERARKQPSEIDLEIREIERKLTENLGTRVQIERKERGGKLTIDFFHTDDLKALLERFEKGLGTENSENEIMELREAGNEASDETTSNLEEDVVQAVQEEGTNEDEDLYSVKNFTV